MHHRYFKVLLSQISMFKLHSDSVSHLFLCVSVCVSVCVCL